MATNRPTSVVVVGAGVSGLTTAVELARAGFEVEVVAAEVPGRTSMAAGALWGPYLVEPADLVRRWSQVSFDIFSDLAQDNSTGVRMATGVEASRELSDPPPWADQLVDFRVCEPHELPDGFKSGWHFTAPLVDMPVYLDYLVGLLQGLGGSVRTVPMFDSLDAVERRSAILVNCSGSGSRALVPDDSVTAIKGHLVVVENPGLVEFFSEETGDSPRLTHWYPHSGSVVLGGVAQEGNWRLEPDLTDAERILSRCAAIEGAFDGAKVLEQRTGLRPTRATVRVEVEHRPGYSIVHNYGHGGAGVTLSWGCARAAVDLVRGCPSRDFRASE